MPLPRIRLVTRGDDSGSCRSANRAVRDAFKEGILRNASVMAAGPAFDEAAEMLKDLKGLCIGLHGTLTDEWNEARWGPVLPRDKVPSLVMDDGTFFKDTGALWNHTPRPRLDEIVAELAAQLQRARSKGLAVRYLDEHMGFGWFEGLAERMAAFAKAEGLLFRPKGLAALPDPKGEFADPVERFIARLDAAEPGKTYLVVLHPAYDDAELRAMTYGDEKPGKIARERDWDRRLYTESRVVEYCRQHEVEAIRFTDIEGA
ncbi:MAG: ChbG/HpnK family deacetylase [Planctomycetes bacterium]|nr:ChbG/HpnK family deacetylase [Planctomycetota bacterium]